MDDENSEEARMRVRTKIGQVKSILILFYAKRSGVKWGFPYRFFSETCACQSNRRKSFMRPISVERILGIRLSVNLFSGVIINLVRNSSV